MKSSTIKTIAYIFICISSIGVSFTWSKNSNINFRTELVKNAIKDFVLQKFELPETDILIEFPNLDALVNKLNYKGKIRVLPGKTGLRKGIQNIKCGVLQHGQLKESFTVSIRIKTFQNIITSNERLARQQVLAPGHLKINRLETTHISDKIFTSIDGLVGLRTKRIINTGEIITNKQVELLPLVNRGKKMDIYFQRGALEIILRGVSRQDGYLGDKIRIKCLETNKIFTGQIIDANTVIVNL